MEDTYGSAVNGEINVIEDESLDVFDDASEQKESDSVEDSSANDESEQKEPKAEEPDEIAESITKHSRYQKRISNLTRKIRELEKTNEFLREKYERGKSPENLEDEYYYEDDDGDGIVNFKNTNISPELAQYLASINALKEEVNALREWRNSLEEIERQNAFNDAVETVRNTIRESTNDLLTERFPNLDKVYVNDICDWITEKTERDIVRKVENGEDFSPNLVTSTMTESLTNAAKMFAALGVEHVKNNQEYSEKYKFKSTGVAGVPSDVSLDNMSRKERNNFIDKITRMVEESRRKET